MKRIFLILCCSIILMAGQCNKETANCHRYITIANNSDYELDMSFSGEYPDSLSSTGFGTRYPSYNLPIPPYTTGRYEILGAGSCLETRIGYINEYGIFMFFLFDSQVLKTMPWDTIVKYRMYLKKYDMTVADLNNSNWTITYP